MHRVDCGVLTDEIKSKASIFSFHTSGKCLTYGRFRSFGPWAVSSSCIGKCSVSDMVRISHAVSYMCEWCVDSDRDSEFHEGKKGIKKYKEVTKSIKKQQEVVRGTNQNFELVMSFCNIDEMLYDFCRSSSHCFASMYHSSSHNNNIDLTSHIDHFAMMKNLCLSFNVHLSNHSAMLFMTLTDALCI